jgi:cell division protein FtsB
MRRTNTITRVGKVNMPAPFSKEFALLLVLVVAAVWVAVAFAQEVLFTQQLNAQAASLRRQNAAIAAANDGYRRDLSASSTGATAGEDARQHGYARPDEKVYVVGGAAPAATPAAVASTAPKAKSSGGVKQNGPWESLGRWIADFWHR